jgi:dehydrogenase/reductase SDR family member 7B
VGRTDLSGKVVWITGASSGIGEALAHALAARGSRLVLSSRREDVLENVRSKCTNPDQHFVRPLDMIDTDSFSSAIQEVHERFGQIDVLVHCAGISQRGIAIDTEIKVDRQLMELNYLGPVALTKQCLPSMLARESGHIVVISSLLGKFAMPKRAAYSASKHALHGFFDSLRAELHGQGIVVTLICPGFIRTNASIHALEGDGTKHNQMDKEIAHGLPADECARQIVKAIERRRDEVYVCRKERIGLYVSRFAPALFRRIVRLRKRG